MPFTATPLAEALGVRIEGFDLAGPWSVDDRDRLRACFAAHHLLLFRGQPVEPEVQVDLCRTLGPVVDPVAWVSNVEDGFHPEGALLFHSDYVFTGRPMLGLSLYAVEVGAGAAPTRFASGVHACRVLSPALRAQADAADVVHVIDAVSGKENVRTRLADVGGDDAPIDRYPRHAGPAVVLHPTTGEPVLVVLEQQTSHVVGRDAAEGEALLQQLFAHLYREDAVYDHHWREHDLVVWDNIALQHGRRANPRTVRRSLRRVAIHDVTTADLIAGTGFDPAWRRAHGRA